MSGAAPLPAPDLSRSGRQQWSGPAGDVELWVDRPDPATCAPTGVVVIGHPQPLLGGSARHKLPHALARWLADRGFIVLRPNFRGVGHSAGVHDAGRGEADDLLALSEAARRALPDLPLVLIGISFGAYVCALVADRLHRAGRAAKRVVLVAMPDGQVPAGRRYDTPGPPPAALVVHGERDEQVPLPLILAWARRGEQPLHVIPGADHLLTGRVDVLQRLLARHLA